MAGDDNFQKGDKNKLGLRDLYNEVHEDFTEMCKQFMNDYEVKQIVKLALVNDQNHATIWGKHHPPKGLYLRLLEMLREENFDAEIFVYTKTWAAEEHQNHFTITIWLTDLPVDWVVGRKGKIEAQKTICSGIYDNYGARSDL